MMRFNSVFGVFFLAFLLGCSGGKSRIDVDTRDIQVTDIRIHRYDLDLFAVQVHHLKAGLDKIKPAYHFFLDTDLDDPVRLTEMKAYLENPRNLDFYQAVLKKYQDLTFLEKNMTEAFRHYRYYYPDASIPRVYAYISGGDYDYPIQSADSVILIGLDNYLGKEFKVYRSDRIPQYRLEKMTADHILPDCMQVMARTAPSSRISGNTLLDQMIEEGRRLYFTSSMIPLTDPRFILGYTRAQMDWVLKNEAQVWAAIIEHRMLYSTDGQIIRTFIADGPFTPEFSKEAPARLGQWIGWQIIRQYMEKEVNVSLPQMLQETDAQKILTQSKYKPQK